jgi:ketosteroid isomerase-like protein
VPVEQWFYTVCGVRDGKISLIHDFMDRKDALEAAGLRD